jgi:hypothetical protein
MEFDYDTNVLKLFEIDESMIGSHIIKIVLQD